MTLDPSTLTIKLSKCIYSIILVLSLIIFSVLLVYQIICIYSVLYIYEYQSPILLPSSISSVLTISIGSNPLITSVN